MGTMERRATALAQGTGTTAGTSEAASDAVNMKGFAGARIQLPSTSTATNLKVYGKLDGASEYALCQDGNQNDADVTISAGALLVDVTRFVYGVHQIKIVLNVASTVHVALVS